MSRMTKRAGSLLTAFVLAAGLLLSPVPAKADALRVVTLGADLSDAQKQTMLKYFKVNQDEVRIIYVTNQDERNHLGSYVPLEQIGTRTVSCAYVRPTTSGGIKVRTANLNWVTGNMIATSLSTSGVKNCEVIAACPFEVSGTGALTGVLMAYEVASGEALDEAKKEIATQEIITTANLANEVGQDQAVNVVNKAKAEVISNNIQNADEIYNTVVNIINQNGVMISAEEIDTIVALLEEIAAQHYDYEDVEDTLVMIDHNVAGVADESVAAFEEEEDDPMMDDEDDEWVDEDSIVLGLDESVLGEDIVVSSTDFADQTAAQASEDDGWEVYEGGEDFLIEDAPADEDEYVFELDGEDEEEDDGDDLLLMEETIGEDPAADDADDMDDEEGDELSLLDDDEIFGEEDLIDAEAVADSEDELALDEWDTSFLSEISQDRFEQASLFCQGEYEGDAEALQEAMGGWAYDPEVELSEDTGESLTKLVLKKYLSILGNGAAYTPDVSDPYVSAELNAMYQALQKIFGVNGAKQDKDAAKVLKKVSEEDAEILYEDTISFFEDLYGEVALDAYEDIDDEADDEEGWEEFELEEEGLDELDLDESDVEIWE